MTYKERFLVSEGLTTADFIKCYHCDRKADDLYHINIKGMGGRKVFTLLDKEYDIDHPLNIIPLCRRCHKLAHAGTLSPSALRLLKNARGKKML